MTELDIAVDVLHDWLEEHGKCIRDTDDADVDEGGLDDIFYNNTENRGGNNRQLDDNTTISSPSKCTTFGRMIGGWHSNGEENVLEFDPELVSYHHYSLLKKIDHKIFVLRSTTNILTCSRSPRGLVRHVVVISVAVNAIMILLPLCQIAEI